MAIIVKGVSLCVFYTPILSSSIGLLPLFWGRETLRDFYGFETGLIHIDLQ